jgi:hypothetical protein
MNVNFTKLRSDTFRKVWRMVAGAGMMDRLLCRGGEA